MKTRRDQTLLVCTVLFSLWTGSICFIPLDPSLGLSIRQNSYNSQKTLCLESRDNNDCLWEALRGRFQGDFDNFKQVLQDRSEGLLPREGGGHEHIHCTLVPVANNARLAAFYFDGRPDAIFRFRYYQLVPFVSDESAIVAVDTILYTLNAELEKQLRTFSSDPLTWPAIFNAFPSGNRTILLPKCDVRWSWNMDPVLHAYAADYSALSHQEPGIHAVMVYGEALVESQMMPGRQILIKDQLSLWSDELWIHDRGYDPDTGKFIYGNQKGVPYRLERVAAMTHDADRLDRQVATQNLEWTLGPQFRTEQEYEAKLALVGGGSGPKR
jgi:hypothetical protein